MPVLLVEFIGNVMLRLHQVLLEFFLGIAAPPCGVPEFASGFGAPGIQVGGGAQFSCLLCRRRSGTPFFGGLPAGVLGVPAVMGPRRP